jgi:hypothetical protein
MNAANPVKLISKRLPSDGYNILLTHFVVKNSNGGIVHQDFFVHPAPETIPPSSLTTTS